MQAAYGVQPGNHISVKSTSEALHLTLAYAAISSVVAAIQEWQDLRGAEVSLHPFCLPLLGCVSHVTLTLVGVLLSMLERGGSWLQQVYVIVQPVCFALCQQHCSIIARSAQVVCRGGKALTCQLTDQKHLTCVIGCPQRCACMYQCLGI